MSAGVESSWAEVAAELPSLVEGLEFEDIKHKEERSIRRFGSVWDIRRQRNLIINRIDYESEDSEDEDYDASRPLEPEEADFREMRDYRRGWKRWKCRWCGPFEDNTSLRPMRYTTGTIPRDARTEVILEIFSVQVTEIKDGLEWPLHVYGHIAARDVVDQNRNLIFNRKRDNCQILTQQDSCLLLTGPSRPVMIIDPVTFEVDLKVKGETVSEDKVLSLKVFVKRSDDFITLRRCFSKHCTVEFTFAVARQAVEATVYSVKVISGSWPDHLRGEVVSRANSVAQKDIVLLDSRHGRMPITSDGSLELSRNVVSVTLGEELSIRVVASQVGDNSVVVEEGKAVFTSKTSGWSHGKCCLGFCELEVTLAWSLFTITADRHAHERASILNSFRH